MTTAVSALILVADDDPFNLRLLHELCEAAGYRVATAADGGQVLDMVARERPDLVLMDVAMPVMDGFEVMRILKADSNLMHIPVVLVTAAGDLDAKSSGLELGAEDYITKPYRIFEIQQRIRNALRLHAAEAAVNEAREQARAKEMVDPLTRAGTSQQLLVSLDYEYTRAERYGQPLTCLVVRVMNYRAIVDMANNETGEGILVQIANGLRSCVRVIDHLFRSDIDEFTLILPATNEEGADTVLHRIRAKAKDNTLWGAPAEPVPIIGVGYETYPSGKAETGDALRRQALQRVRAS